jgi:FMN hydrolase / 5-amino-6-(5-phospho-D-ribitylamino)uracil phosphatase
VVTVRVVAFDLMDTVVRDPFREALEAATGLGLRELFERRDPTVYPAFERGEIDEAAYWAHYEAAGIAVDPATFHRIRREGIAFLPGMAALLDELAAHVVRVTASNYPVWVEELARDHLAGRFERIIASHHLGVRKPDRAFYERLVATVEVAADEVCFVDDRHDNVEAARQAGLRAHRFAGVAGLRGWLADHGVPVRRTA